MLLFEYILILLAAILLSNFIHRFLPLVSVPIIQIVLGAGIALIPLKIELELNTDLFFVLFIAPLIFYNSLHIDKKSFWMLKKPIFNMAVLLVFLTVIIVGYLVNFLIPSIPLAAAFALTATLGPTDVVAVLSVGKRINLPYKIMHILEGESTINDASGIVCFQFAIAAILTGTFSITHAAGRFFIIALGGAVIGLLFTWIKYVFVKWLRSMGMENVTLHILLGILTPFAIYLLAESLEVSGIIAVFSAGITHSFFREKLNPETVNLNIASDSVWSVLSFTLDGLLFLILGAQLPKILSTLGQNAYSIGILEITAYIFIITSALILLRFAWSTTMIRRKNYTDSESSTSRLRAGIIFSLSGARGTVTMASVLSIPLLLPDGAVFPERDLIILLAFGVILVSLVLTNFILPLFVEKRRTVYPDSDENEALVEVLRSVIQQLNSQTTPENKAATNVVVKSYLRRIDNLQRKQNIHISRKEERKWKVQTYKWKREYVSGLTPSNEIDQYVKSNFIDILNAQILKYSRKRFILFTAAAGKFKRRVEYYQRFRSLKKNTIELRLKFVSIIDASDRFVLKKIHEVFKTDNSPIVQKIILDYELLMSMQNIRNRNLEGAILQSADKESITAVASMSFQVERDCIQEMFEDGRISRETAREMRNNISLLEVEIKKDIL